MKTLSALNELRELLALTEKCAAQAREAKQQARKYAEHYQASAEELKKQAARIRFPEIQARLLRIAASSERLYNLAEGRGDLVQLESQAVPRKPLKTSEQATKRKEDPILQARRHIAEAEFRIERQEALIARLSGDNKYVALADEAREILITLKHTLRLARDHLALELKK